MKTKRLLFLSMVQCLVDGLKAQTFEQHHTNGTRVRLHLIILLLILMLLPSGMRANITLYVHADQTPCLYAWNNTSHQASPQTGSKTLVIEQRSGGSTIFVMADTPVMTFSNHVLYVSVNGSNTSFEISDVRYFYLSDYNGIELASSDKLTIKYQSDDNVIISGVNQNDRVSLYFIDGMALPDRVNISGSQAEISLSALPKGTYIVNVHNKQTFKIHKK